MPSTEDSIGTTARSAAPVRTASSVAPMVAHGTGSTSPAGRRPASASLATAASVNVPSGPR